MGLGKRQTPRKGDYYNDKNVLICGTCGKPREWHGIWPGIGLTWAACICDCDKRKHFADIEADELAKKKVIAKMHREWAFPHGSSLHTVTLDCDDKIDLKVSKAVGEYVRALNKNYQQGRNLLLFGDVGTGKTFFAAAVLNAAIDEGYKCLFTSFAREVNEITKAHDKNEYLRELKSYDFVVFDDFGVERETEYNLEQIYQIVNARYVANKPMIVTTNMGVEELNTEEINKKRIISRIAEKVVTVPFWGEDRRKQNHKRGG